MDTAVWIGARFLRVTWIQLFLQNNVSELSMTFVLSLGWQVQLRQLY
jgi:hypothetical protein